MQKPTPSSETVDVAPFLNTSRAVFVLVTHTISLFWQLNRLVDDGAESYQLFDSADYFFDSVERLSAPDYLPSNQVGGRQATE